MPLTESEAADVYGILAEMLRNQELGWLFDAVEARIALGRTVTRRVRDSELSNQREAILEPEYPTRRGGGPQVFTAVETLSARERLLLLVDAIEFGVVLPPKIAETTLETLRRYEPSIDSLRFEEEQEIGETFDVTDAEIIAHLRASDNLLRLLDQLREVVG
jgi:hypothetical protein